MEGSKNVWGIYKFPSGQITTIQCFEASMFLHQLYRTKNDLFPNNKPEEKCLDRRLVCGITDINFEQKEYTQKSKRHTVF